MNEQQHEPQASEEQNIPVEPENTSTTSPADGDDLANDFLSFLRHVIIGVIFYLKQ